MTTEKNTQSAKAPYRVEVTTYTRNPKYIPGSFAPTTRHREVASKTAKPFETLEAAKAYQATNGGFVQALSSTGKSYRMVK